MLLQGLVAFGAVWIFIFYFFGGGGCEENSMQPLSDVTSDWWVRLALRVSFYLLMEKGVAGWVLLPWALLFGDLGGPRGAAVGPAGRCGKLLGVGQGCPQETMEAALGGGPFSAGVNFCAFKYAAETEGERRDLGEGFRCEVPGPPQQSRVPSWGTAA